MEIISIRRIGCSRQLHQCERCTLAMKHEPHICVYGKLYPTDDQPENVFYCFQCAKEAGLNVDKEEEPQDQGNICQCGHSYWSHSNSGIGCPPGCLIANCRCDLFVLSESPDDET